MGGVPVNFGSGLDLQDQETELGPGSTLREVSLPLSLSLSNHSLSFSLKNYNKTMIFLKKEQQKKLHFLAPYLERGQCPWGFSVTLLYPHDKTRATESVTKSYSSVPRINEDTCTLLPQHSLAYLKKRNSMTGLVPICILPIH